MILRAELDPVEALLDGDAPGLEVPVAAREFGPHRGLRTDELRLLRRFQQRLAALDQIASQIVVAVGECERDAPVRLVDPASRTEPTRVRQDLADRHPVA